MKKTSAGWSVWRTRDGALILLPGDDTGGPPHPDYLFLGWTFGTRADGKALLAEIRAERQSEVR